MDRGGAGTYIPSGMLAHVRLSAGLLACGCLAIAAMAAPAPAPRSDGSCWPGAVGTDRDPRREEAKAATAAAPAKAKAPAKADSEA